MHQKHVYGSIAVLLAFNLLGCRPEKPDLVIRHPPALQTSSQPTPSEPRSVLIDVPFATQAPRANWDALHEEACEEASLILVHYFLKGMNITPEMMEKEIQELVAWETEHGYGYDVTIAQLRDIAKAKYELSATIIKEVSVERIKAEIRAGNPIIVPAAGRELGNPYFSGEGPWYHMLVITGFDSKNFITNDVGTKRGQSYRYSYDVLLNAIHDWTGVKEETKTGAKRMMILSR